MTPSTEVLARLRTLITQDLNQRFQGVMNTVEQQRVTRIHMQLSCDESKGFVPGKASFSELPQYIDTTVQQYSRHYAPWIMYDRIDDRTYWMDIAQPVGQDGRISAWPHELQADQMLNLTRRLYLMIWEHFQTGWNKPFHFNRRGEFQILFDKRREIEFLQKSGLGLVIMVFRNPDEVMSIDRKFEESFVRSVDVGSGPQSLRSVEDFDLLLESIDEMSGQEVASHPEHSDLVELDDPDFVQWLGGQAYRIKSVYGKDAGHLAFSMHSAVKKRLSCRRPS